MPPNPDIATDMGRDAARFGSYFTTVEVIEP
jgi:hypothetical protein